MVADQAANQDNREHMNEQELEEIAIQIFQTTTMSLWQAKECVDVFYKAGFRGMQIFHVAHMCNTNGWTAIEFVNAHRQFADHKSDDGIDYTRLKADIEYRMNEAGYYF